MRAVGQPDPSESSLSSLALGQAADPQSGRIWLALFFSASCNGCDGQTFPFLLCLLRLHRAFHLGFAVADAIGFFALLGDYQYLFAGFFCMFLRHSEGDTPAF